MLPVKIKNYFAEQMNNLKQSLKVLQNNRGMSLIEILIVLTLIGLTATFITGKLFDSLEEGKEKAAKIQMANIAGILKNYRRYCGRYPTTEQGLEALASEPTAEPKCKRYPKGGLLEEGATIPLDPWDHEYVYTSNDGSTFKLATMGRKQLEAEESEYIYYRP